MNTNNINNHRPNEDAKSSNFDDTKWCKVLKKGNERQIIFFIVVELFRFVFYLWFVVFFIVGLSFTHGLAPYLEDNHYKKSVSKVFGKINDSGIFGIPPWTYVLPTFYAIQLVIIFQYCILSVFRAWIAKLENKITGKSFALYFSVFSYFFLSTAVFSTIFAIQPDIQKPNTILIHTLLFTNLIIALSLLQVAVTWFGRNVSWKELKHHSKFSKKCLRWGSEACMVALVITSTLKIIHQINAVGALNFTEDSDITKENTNDVDTIDSKPDDTQQKYQPHGMWFNVHDDSVQLALEFVDKLWLIMALFCPMIQSLYLTSKGLDTHGIIISIEDNRKGMKKTRATSNSIISEIEGASQGDILEMNHIS